MNKMLENFGILIVLIIMLVFFGKRLKETLRPRYPLVNPPVAFYHAIPAKILGDDNVDSDLADICLQRSRERCIV